MKVTKELYERIQDIRDKTKLSTDADAIRFCVTYTATSLEALDEKHITEALGIAIAESLFNTDEPESETKPDT